MFNSCSADEKPDEIYSDTANLNIKLNALDSNVKIRIIITDRSDGEILLNDANLDLSLPYRTKVKTGSLNLYVIGNEPDRLKSSFNNLLHENNIFPLTILRTELPSEEQPPNSSENSNLPLIKIIPIQVKAENNDPETGMISDDNGLTWSKTLEVTLERLAVKVHLKMRKNTLIPADKVTVKKVNLTNIPAYSYWYPDKSYTSDEFLPPESAYSDNTGIIFIENADTGQDDNYTTIFNGFILPEYIAAVPTQESKAVSLVVYVVYNNEQRIFNIPLRTFPNAPTFSLVRNSEHTLNVTVVNKGEIVVSPEIKYEVSDWDDAKNDIEDGKVVTYEAKWGDNTPRNDQNIFLASDKTLEFKFKLVHPAGSTWKATLSNPLYFEFDNSNGAVSAGMGGSNNERTIRIKPRKSVNVNGIKTDFFITVNYGSEHVELDLPNQNVGAGNRYSINLIPD